MRGTRARAIRQLRREAYVANRLGLVDRAAECMRAMGEAQRGGSGWRARAQIPEAELELAGDARQAAAAIDTARRASKVRVGR